MGIYEDAMNTQTVLDRIYGTTKAKKEKYSPYGAYTTLSDNEASGEYAGVQKSQAYKDKVSYERRNKVDLLTQNPYGPIGTTQYKDPNTYEDTGPIERAVNWIDDGYDTVVDYVFGSSTPKTAKEKKAAIEDNNIEVWDGQKVTTKNKIRNDMSSQELTTMFYGLEEEADAKDILYVARVDNIDGTTSIKYGTTTIDPYTRTSDFKREKDLTYLYAIRTSKAKEMEALIHGNKGMLKERRFALGQDKEEYGSGSTEIYNKDLFGLDGTVTTDKLRTLNMSSRAKLKELGLNVNNRYDEQGLDLAYKELEKTKSIYGEKSDNYKTLYTAMNNVQQIDRKDHMGLLKKSGDLVDALQSGGQQVLLSTADMVLDAVVPGNSTLLDNTKSARQADKTWGYKGRDEASRLGSQALREWNKGNYTGALFKGLQAGPDVIAQSLPDMALMFVGGAGVAAKVASIEKAYDVGKITKKVYNAQVAAAEASTVMNHLKRNAGLVTFAGKQTNNQIDDRLANGDEAVGLAQTAAMFMSNYALAGLDRVAFEGEIGLSSSIKKAIKALPESKLVDVAVGAANIARKLAVAGSVEGAQEFVQSYGETINSGLGTKMYGDDPFSKHFLDEATKGMLLGVGSGVSISGAVQAGSVYSKRRTPNTASTEETPIDETGTEGASVGEIHEAFKTTAGNYTDKVIDAPSTLMELLNMEEDMTNAETEVRKEYEDTLDIVLNELKTENLSDAQATKLGSDANALGIIMTLGSDPTEVGNKNIDKIIGDDEALRDVVEAIKDTKDVERNIQFGATKFGDYRSIGGYIKAYIKAKSKNESMDEINFSVGRFISTQKARVELLTKGMEDATEHFNNNPEDTSFTVKDYIVEEGGSKGNPWEIWRDNKKENKLAAGTSNTIKQIERTISTLKSIQTYFNQEEVVPKNPVKPKPKEPAEPINPFMAVQTYGNNGISYHTIEGKKILQSTIRKRFLGVYTYKGARPSNRTIGKALRSTVDDKLTPKEKAIRTAMKEALKNIVTEEQVYSEPRFDVFKENKGSKATFTKLKNMLKRKYSDFAFTDKGGNDVTKNVTTQFTVDGDALSTSDEVESQSDLEAMTILVNEDLMTLDTLPREYATHYINWFIDTPIVQEGIEKWGNEKALVQAMANKVVDENGKAWWKRFITTIKGFMKSLSTTSKEDLRDALTNALLKGTDLNKLTREVGKTKKKKVSTTKIISGDLPSIISAKFSKYTDESVALVKAYWKEHTNKNLPLKGFFDYAEKTLVKKKVSTTKIISGDLPFKINIRFYMYTDESVALVKAYWKEHTDKDVPLGNFLNYAKDTLVEKEVSIGSIVVIPRTGGNLGFKAKDNFIETSRTVKSFEEAGEVFRDLSRMYGGVTFDEKYFSMANKFAAIIGFREFKIELNSGVSKFSVNPGSNPPFDMTTDGTLNIYYNHRTHVNPAFILFHEYIHHITASTYYKGQVLRSDKAALDLYKYVKGKLTDEQLRNYRHGMSNVNEFFAVGMESPGLAAILNNIPYGNTTVFEKLVQIFNKIFHTDTTNDTALSEMLSIIAVMNETKGLGEVNTTIDLESDSTEKVEATLSGMVDFATKKKALADAIAEVEDRLIELEKSIGFFADSTNASDIKALAAAKKEFTATSKKLQKLELFVNRPSPSTDPFDLGGIVDYTDSLYDVTLESMKQPAIRVRMRNILDNFRKVRKSKNTDYINGIYAGSNLQKSPAMNVFLDISGNYKEDLLLIADTVARTMLLDNASNLGSFISRDAAADMLGYIDGSDVPTEAVMTLSGKGTLLNGYVDQVGSAIAKALGLKESITAPFGDFNRLVTSLGTTATMSLVKEGLLEIGRMPTEDYVKLLAKGVVVKDTEANVLFVKLALDTEGSPILDSLKKTNIKSSIEAITEIVAEEPLVTRRVPSATPLKYKYGKDMKVHHTHTETHAPNDMVYLRNKRGREKYIPDLESIQWLKDNIGSAKKILGYIFDADTEYTESSAEKQLAIKGKNEQIDKSLEDILTLLEEGNPLADGMYFDHTVSRNTRVGSTSNTIDPMNNILHRFLLSAESSKKTYNFDNQKEMDAFYLFLAQAMGEKIDGKGTTIDALIKKGKDILNNEVSTLQDALDKGTYEGELSHALNGVSAMAAYWEAKGNNATSFDSTLLGETDHRTNGFAHKVDQFPLFNLTKLKTMLGQVGIYFGKGHNKSAIEYSAQDAYEQNGKVLNVNSPVIVALADKLNGHQKSVWAQLKLVIPSSDNIDQASDIRSMLKPLFMIFNYSAGMKSIRRTLGRLLAEDILNQMALGNPKYDALAKSLFGNSTTYRTDLQTLPPNRVKTITGRPAKKAIMEILDATYGVVIEESFLANYKPFTEANKLVNASFRFMFENFSKKLNDRFPEGSNNKELREWLEGDGKKFIPKIATPFEGYDLPIITNVKQRNTAVDKVITTLEKSSEADNATISTQAILREFATAISAGSVLPIHTMDAYNITQTGLKYPHMLLVHDAIVGSPLELLEAALYQNKTYAEMHRKYSIVESVYASLASIEDRDLTMVVSTSMYKGITGTAPKKGTVLEVTIGDFTEYFDSELLSKVQAGRTLLAREYRTFENMVATSESAYELEPKQDDLTTILKSDENNHTMEEAKLVASNLHKSPKDIVGYIDNLDEIDNVTTTKEVKDNLKEVLGLFDSSTLENLDLYVSENNPTNSGTYEIPTGKIVVGLASANAEEMQYQKSAAEVYAHEVVHAFTVTMLRLKGNPVVDKLTRRVRLLSIKAKKALTPKALIDAGVVKDIKGARVLIDYMFNNKAGTGLEEFVAHGLTNPAIVRILKDARFKEPKDANNSIFEKLASVFRTLVEFITGTKYRTSSESIYDELVTLSVKLNEAEVKIQNKMKKGAGTTMGLLSGTNAKTVELIEWAKGLVLPKGEELPILPKNPTKLQSTTFLVKALTVAVTDGRFKPKLEKVLSAFNAKPTGTLQGILRDLQTPEDHSLERTLEGLKADADMVDERRLNALKTIADLMTKQFRKGISKEQNRAILEVVLDTDLSSIVKDYSIKEIARVVADKAYRHSIVEEMLNEVLDSVQNDKKQWVKSQINGLAFYTVHGTVGVKGVDASPYNKNARNIVEGLFNVGNKGTILNSGSIHKADSIASKIDKIASMKSLDYVSSTSIDLVSTMLRTEPRAMKMVMENAEVVKSQSSNSIFNSDEQRHMLKGYSTEIYDSNKEIKYARKDEVKELKNLGFKNVDRYELMGETMFLMTRENSRAGYVSASTVMNHLTSKGLTGKTIYKGRADERYTQMGKLSKSMHREALRAGREEVREFVTVGNLLPIINPSTREIVDYSHVPSKYYKRKHLGADMRGIKVLSNTLSTVTYKQEAKEQNESVFTIIKEDARQNWRPNKKEGKNGYSYIEIKADSDNKLVKAIYEKLPDNMKDSIDKEGGKIAVRESMLNQYFGYQELRLSQATKIQENYKVQNFLRVTGNVWEDLIKKYKGLVVIKTSAVAVGNNVSNYVQIVSRGRNPVEVTKRFVSMFRESLEYVALNKLLIIEENKVARGYKSSTIHRIRSDMERMSVHELFGMGLFGGIEEIDVTDIDSNSRSSVDKLIDRGRDKLPKVVLTGLDYLFITDRTKLYSTLARGVQLSDFVGRAVENSFLLEDAKMSKAERVNTLRDMFINYSKLDSPVEEWLQRNGILMFWKYAKNIQRTIFKTAKDYPLYMLMLLLGQHYVIDVEDVMEKSIFTNSGETFNGYDSVNDIFGLWSPALVDNAVWATN